MPFLDTNVTLSPGGITSSVFRKKTDTNVLLHYDAIAPNVWKTGLIKCMLNRAEVVCSDKHTREKEYIKLKDIFTSNGYPSLLFDKVKDQFVEARRIRDEENPDEQSPSAAETKHILKVPFIGKSSIMYAKKLRKLFSSMKADVRVVYSTTKVLDSFQLKDPVPKELRPKVVYQFTCRGDPDTTYVGFTNRTLKERFKEHVSGGTSISDHIANCKPCQDQGVTLDDFTILRKCRRKEDTSVHEALIITEKNPVLNRQLVKPGGKQFTLQIFD